MCVCIYTCSNVCDVYICVEITGCLTLLLTYQGKVFHLDSLPNPTSAAGHPAPGVRCPASREMRLKVAHHAHLALSVCAADPNCAPYACVVYHVPYTLSTFPDSKVNLNRKHSFSSFENRGKFVVI